MSSKVLPALVVLILLGAGIFYFLSSGSTSEVQPIRTPPPTNSQQTIVIEDNLSISFTLPAGYSLKEGYGVWSNIIANSKERPVLNFSYTLPAGETLKILGDTQIDGVNFLIQDAARVECGATLLPKEESYFIEMVLGCDPSSPDQAVVQQIISSIKFSPELKTKLKKSR